MRVRVPPPLPNSFFLCHIARKASVRPSVRSDASRHIVVESPLHRPARRDAPLEVPSGSPACRPIPSPPAPCPKPSALPSSPRHAVVPVPYDALGRMSSVTARVHACRVRGDVASHPSHDAESDACSHAVGCEWHARPMPRLAFRPPTCGAPGHAPCPSVPVTCSACVPSRRISACPSCVRHAHPVARPVARARTPGLGGGAHAGYRLPKASHSFAYGIARRTGDAHSGLHRHDNQAAP